MVAHLYRKVTPEMSRQEKETIIHAELMKTDRIFARNCMEMDLAFGFGRETAIRFILKIEKQEAAIGRKLNAPEIEEVYQHFIEGLKNGNSNRYN
jgi:hypothetical protein